MGLASSLDETLPSYGMMEEYTTKPMKPSRIKKYRASFRVAGQTDKKKHKGFFSRYLQSQWSYPFVFVPNPQSGFTPTTIIGGDL